MKFRKLALALAGFALAAASFAASAADLVFNNTAPIAIPTSGSFGPANPYPSTINVAGLSGNIDQVSVTLNGFSHTWSGDLVIVLVSPAGQKVSLINRVGGSADYTGGNYTFIDSAAGTVSGSPIAPGSYQASGGSYSAQAPAPPAPYSNSLNSMGGAGSTLNGTWSLFVDDLAGGDVGQIAGGWSLAFADAISCASEGYTGMKLTWCQNICEKGYSGATLDAWIRRWITRYREMPYCAVENEQPPA